MRRVAPRNLPELPTSWPTRVRPSDCPLNHSGLRIVEAIMKVCVGLLMMLFVCTAPAFAQRGGGGGHFGGGGGVRGGGGRVGGGFIPHGGPGAFHGTPESRGE